MYVDFFHYKETGVIKIIFDFRISWLFYWKYMYT